MQYEDLILNLCIISIRVCGWPVGSCNGESNSPCPALSCTIRCCYWDTASAQLEEQVFHRWTAAGLLTAVPNNTVLGNSSPGSLLKGSANCSCSCPPTINHIFSLPPPLRYSNTARWGGPTKEKETQTTQEVRERATDLFSRCTSGRKEKVGKLEWWINGGQKTTDCKVSQC